MVPTMPMAMQVMKERRESRHDILRAEPIDSLVFAILIILFSRYFNKYPRSIVKCNNCKSWKELFKILA